MDDDNGEAAWAPVMPFLPVTSKGGPFDDQAYVAGYEMGLLCRALSDEDATEPISQVILSANVGQADLLAMRFGWHLEAVFPADDGTWTAIELLRAEGPEVSS